ncbi:hypothetical protein ACFX2F_030289 [Malus domestica]
MRHWVAKFLIKKNQVIKKFSQTNMVSNGRSKVISLINICGVVKCVVIVIPGHPVVVEQLISSADALVAAWPPELK